MQTCCCFLQHQAAKQNKHGRSCVFFTRVFWKHFFFTTIPSLVLLLKYEFIYQLRTGLHLLRYTLCTKNNNRRWERCCLSTLTNSKNSPPYHLKTLLGSRSHAHFKHCSAIVHTHIWNIARFSFTRTFETVLVHTHIWNKSIYKAVSL